ncbi:diguanylate cyclase (GGDEF)-like protein [Sporomusaceae bacterium BoRhaA]|uniref:GGDEF domain-containing protein n=1 Tax=Pelorhabdus rhamnosifermentans TaxID=2772457 RepID=UPI001C0612A3|nr:GGDEF domain-containing protein [Pelorhabdus rhamnosifermentans]MBU2700804.1 diguanylate cyclase (GGDEF)-like protein [Pelorhabdus rhamnosifermentans]
MKYTGRIIGLIIMLMTIIAIRIYAYIYLDYPLTALPIAGIFSLVFVYWVGKKYDQVKFYSERDSLTGLYNRRVIDTIFPILLAQTDRKNESLGILILDCNNFKTINDTQGHIKGDLVLREVAASLLNVTRKTDLVARWGGDEFLIIVPNTDEKKIKIVISRIETKLHELSRKLQISISVASGFSIYPQNATNFNDLIVVADKMMYSIKNKLR